MWNGDHAEIFFEMAVQHTVQDTFVSKSKIQPPTNKERRFSIGTEFELALLFRPYKCKLAKQIVRTKKLLT